MFVDSAHLCSRRPQLSTAIRGFPVILGQLGLAEGSVDCVLTSPPYATALPYVDTDRLSLLALFGLTSKSRRPLELSLTGSREILTRSRRTLEAQIHDGSVRSVLPSHVVDFVGELLREVESRDVGFRRRNNPSLLLRFFCDMKDTLAICHKALRFDGDLVLVVGDNTGSIGRYAYSDTYDRFCAGHCYGGRLRIHRKP